MDQATASDAIELPKVAFIAGGLAFGGATTLLHGLAGGLAARGVPVLVCSLEADNALADEFAGLRIPLLVCNQHEKIFEDRVEEVLKTLAEFQPSVVVAWIAPSASEILRYVPPPIRRLAVVHCDHEMFYAALRPYASHLDGVVGVSRRISEVVAQSAAFAGLKSICINNGIAVPELPIARDANRDRPLRVLYFGRLERHQKRVHLFPQILQQLVQSGIAFRWTIAGNGPERKFLEQNMKPVRPHQQVKLLGAIAHREIAQLLEDNDVFLLASATEGLPMSLLEAMAYGMVPVVTRLHSGVCDVVDETNGILVEPDDTAGYARAILRLNNDRADLAARSGKARAKIAAEFSLTTMTRAWVQALNGPLREPALWPERYTLQLPLTAKGSPFLHRALRGVRRLGRRLKTARKT